MPDAYSEWDKEIHERGKNHPTRPAERRARRCRVEQMYLEHSLTKDQMAIEIAKEFKVHPHTVWQDIGRLIKRYAADDSKFSRGRRLRVLKRFERLYEAALKEGNLKLCVEINKEMARIVGLTEEAKVTQVVNVVQNNKERGKILSDPALRKALDLAGRD